MSKPIVDDVVPLALSVPVAAKTLGVNACTLYRWKKAGIITIAKIGGRALVPASEVTRLLAVPALPGTPPNRP